MRSGNAGQVHEVLLPARDAPRFRTGFPTLQVNAPWANAAGAWRQPARR
jgi:hypothetical protein